MVSHAKTKKVRKCKDCKAVLLDENRNFRCDPCKKERGAVLRRGRRERMAERCNWLCRVCGEGITLDGEGEQDSLWVDMSVSPRALIHRLCGLDEQDREITALAERYGWTCSVCSGEISLEVSNYYDAKYRVIYGDGIAHRGCARMKNGRPYRCE